MNVDIGKVGVWCDDCWDFHQMKDLFVVPAQKGIGYACPKTVEDEAPSILLFQGGAVA